MDHPKQRFVVYALIGLIFGVLDWFYLNWLAHVSWGGLGESILVVPIIIGMNYGIWLVPIIPVTIYEARRAEKSVYPMLAGMLTWSCAIFSYYAYYAALLSFGKLIHLEHLNILGEKYDSFWYEYWQMFKWIILGQFFQWIVIALIGGAVIGALTFRLLRNKARPQRNNQNQKLEDG
jgi:hypothetical protein